MTEAERSYPDQIAITPLDRPVQAEVRVPGSKSITNRALVLAALAGRGQDCFLRRPLRAMLTQWRVQVAAE